MKKLLKNLLTLVVSLSFVTPAFAQKHSLELGTETSYIKYEEPCLMKETGSMYGIVGSYTYRGPVFILNKAMLKAEGKTAWGQLDYTSPISGGMKDISDWLLELRGLAGYDFEVRNLFPLVWTITPYFGIGYRYLNDDSSGKITSLGDSGYERESNYLYSPVGLEVIADLKNNWLIGATAEYDIFWRGIQKSHFDWAGFPELVLENKQDKGYGLRGSVKVQKKGQKIDLIVEPYVRYWNIKQSKMSLIGYEPKNNSTEIGLKLAVQF